MSPYAAPMALTSRQKRTARRKLSARRGIPESRITDADLEQAVQAGVIAMSDLTTSDGGGGYCAPSDGGYSGGDTGGCG